METCICKHCGVELPYSVEYFRKDSKAISGIGHVCKKCENKRNRTRYDSSKKHDYYLTNKETINQKNKENYIANRKKYIESNLKWQKLHPDNKKQNWKKNQDKNREKYIEKGRLYRESHRELLRASAKRYYEENLEKCKTATSKWNHENRETCNNGTQKYRATKRHLESTLTTEQWEMIKKRFDSKCAYCGKESNLHQEHFIALSKGGEFSINNIVPACISCNSSKHDKSFFEWYPKCRHYSKKREQNILKFLSYTGNIQQLMIAEQ